MNILNNNKGFLSILAVVVTVVVGGGTIFYGTKILHDNHSKGCGDMLNKWNSGQAMADLSDPDNLDIIDQSIKCRKAVYDTVKMAKPVASLMSASTNVGGDPQNLGTVIVDRMMDGVDALSEQIPSLKDKPLPDDVQENKDEKDKEKTTQKIDDFLDGVEDELVEIKDQEEAGASGVEDSDDSSASNDEAGNEEQGVDAIDCVIGFSGNSSPKLKFDCPETATPGSTVQIQTHFSDPEGDISGMYVRSKIKIPQYNGSQEGQWTKANFSETKKCGSGKKTEVSVPADLDLSGVSAIFGIEAYLVDSQGNKSEIVACDIIEY